MATTSNPRVSFSVTAAQLASTVKGRNDLICGSLIATATAVSGQLYTDVAQYTKTQLDSLFGVNTDLRNRIDQFIKSNGGYSQLNVKALSEAGGAVKATGQFVFAGSGVATEDGELVVSLVDDYQFKATIPVVTGDTDILVTAKIIAAMSATNFPSMPVLVEAGSTNLITKVTAIDGGTTGNFYKIAISGTVAGLSAITTTPMATGATNPTVTTFFDNLQSSRFTGINWPTAWISTISVVKTYLDSRFNADNAILDGVAFIGKNDTFANNKALALAHNSQSIVFGGNTTALFQPADWSMAFFQGVRSRRLTQDAPIAQYITTTSGTKDAFGSPALASLPYFNTPMNQMSVVNPNDLYSSSEQSELEEAGFSVIGVNSAENGMITSAMVTTYTTDNAGNPNQSFHYLEYVDTSSVCREYFFNNLKARFSQSRLTNGTLISGYSMENESSVRAQFVKLYTQLSKLALTVAGSPAEKFYKKYLTVTLDLANRKTSATMQLPIVTQLGEMICSAQLNFNSQE